MSHISRNAPIATPALRRQISEVSINSERVVTLMRMITPEYFIVLAMRPEGNYGKGRYLMRVVAPKLQQEL